MKETIEDLTTARKRVTIVYIVLFITALLEPNMIEKFVYVFVNTVLYIILMRNINREIRETAHKMRYQRKLLNDKCLDKLNEIYKLAETLGDDKYVIIKYAEQLLMFRTHDIDGYHHVLREYDNIIKQLSGMQYFKVPRDIRNYFYILGLRPDADFASVKAAYRNLMKIYHPDVNNGQNSERAKKINNAYTELKKYFNE